jgi:hypothetical protein
MTDDIDIFIGSIKYNRVKDVTQEMLDEFDKDFKNFAEKYDWIENKISWCNANWTFDGG